MNRLLLIPALLFSSFAFSQMTPFKVIVDTVIEKDSAGIEKCFRIVYHKYYDNMVRGKWRKILVACNPHGKMYKELIIGNYADNKKHGTWKYYNEEGEMILLEEWEHGKLKESTIITPEK